MSDNNAVKKTAKKTNVTSKSTAKTKAVQAKAKKAETVQVEAEQTKAVTTDVEQAKDKQTKSKATTSTQKAKSLNLKPDQLVPFDNHPYNCFSSDELYTKTYITCLKEILDNRNFDFLQMEPTDRKEIREAKSTVKEVIDAKTLIYDKRVGRILLKLAVGHAVYELSKGYSNKWNGMPIYIKYIIKPTVSESEWDDLEYAETMNG